MSFGEGHNPITPEPWPPGGSVPGTELTSDSSGPVPTYHSVVRTVSSVPAGPQELSPGSVVGDYLIHGILGRGGMATVYLAEQRSIGRLIALKVSADRGTEGLTMAQLQHPSIVQVYTETVDVVRNRRYLCMQLVPGTSLDRVLDRLKEMGTTWTGRDLLAVIDRLANLPAVLDTEALRDREELERCGHVEAACWLMRKVALALAHAHEKDVLHRDIKPGNILVDRYGRPLLADFNVSLDPERKAGARGEIFGGTLDYMAPEHLDAFNPTTGVTPAAVDRRSDIYGLGLILFELLIGELPFPAANTGATTPETLTRLAGERRTICPVMVRARITDEALAAVIMRCLAANPDERYSDSLALAQALEDCRERERVLASLPQLGVFGDFLRCRPIVGLSILALLPHLIGTVVNIAYNALRIVSELSERQQVLFGWLVIAYNLLIYPGCLVLLVVVVRPWLQLSFARQRGDTLTGAQFAEVRKQVLRWPMWTAILSCAGWMPGAVFFPLALHVFGGGVPSEVFVRFSVSFLLSCLIALTYAMLGVRFALLRLLYPDLLVQTHGLVETMRRELPWHASKTLTLMAGLIPLLGALGLVFLGPDSSDYQPFRLLLTGLIALGMLGFMLSMSVQEYTDRTLLALRRQVDRT